MNNGAISALQAATNSCLAHRVGLANAQQMVTKCLEANGIAQPTAVADAANANAHGALLDSCWQDPAYSAATATAAPVPTALPGPTVTAAQVAVIQCLENNGIAPADSLTDATSPTAAGALLDLCHANPSYIQEVGFCPSKGGACTTYYGGAAAHATNCPTPLQGKVTGQRIALTIGLQTPTGWRGEPAIVDSGSPSTYVMADQLQGTSFTPLNAVSNILFPFWHNAQYGVPARAYHGTLAVLDGGQWANIGAMDVEALEKSPGPGIKDALGIDAFSVAHLTEEGSGWTMTWPCGG